MTVQAYKADLHIHTLLSPCGEVEMIPSLIVEAARLAGLDIIAICDHNSCQNAQAVIEAAKASPVRVLPGLEVESVEGIHLLCLFDRIEQAAKLQESVYAKLPAVEGHWKFYDEQMIVDCSDEFVAFCERPIGLPASLDIVEVYELACGLDGIVIPSHIDRHESGMCGVLGMVPETPDFDAVEVSANLAPDMARVRYPSIGSRPVFWSSDAHWLSAIGERRTVLNLEHRSVREIRMACRGEGGRSVGDA